MKSHLRDTTPNGASSRVSSRGLRKSILAEVDIRFDVAPLHPYTRRIENVDDVKRLEQLHRGAVQAASLDAFGEL
ncbi:MAG: hypothetical protein OXR72_16025 [Gemmatimonadota bacterium]|nr:hypothetical protein [Gemmatimonadota bacterium]